MNHVQFGREMLLAHYHSNYVSTDNGTFFSSFAQTLENLISGICFEHVKYTPDVSTQNSFPSAFLWVVICNTEKNGGSYTTIQQSHIGNKQKLWNLLFFIRIEK